MKSNVFYISYFIFSFLFVFWLSVFIFVFASLSVPLSTSSHHFVWNSVFPVLSFILCSHLHEGPPSYLWDKLNCHRNTLVFIPISSSLLGLERHIWEDRWSLMKHSCVWVCARGTNSLFTFIDTSQMKGGTRPAHRQHYKSLCSLNHETPLDSTSNSFLFK